jgi:hypothetical protein
VDPGLLLVPLGLAVVCALAWAFWQWEVKHREALQLLAQQRGWTLAERDDSVVDGFTGTPFGTGRRRRARHVLRGTHDGTPGGRPVLAFDYSYETTSSNGKTTQTQTHRFAICAMALPAPVPGLQLTGENALTRLGSTLGLRDLDLESEAFNRRYRVAADDPRFAYDVLHPRTIEALLARPTTNVRMCGDTVLSWDSGRQTPEHLVQTLDHLVLLVDGVPDWVWRDRASGGVG